jgi:hypothetical protein
MTALERRCRRLLRAYPAWYRAERGEEMLATLLEASPPSAQWPSPRDVRALIMGGLKVRAWGNQRPGPAASLRLAVQLGVSVALLWYFSSQLITDVALLTFWPGGDLFRPGLTGNMTAADAMGLALVTAAWLAPRRAVAIALACVAAWLAIVRWRYFGNWVIGIQPAGSLILLAVLIRGRQRLPRSWLWLAAAISVPSIVLRLAQFVLLPPVLASALQVVPWLILGVVVLWAVVDPRPAIALAAWIAFGYLPFVAPRAAPYVIWTEQWYWPAAGAAVVAAAAIWRLRRQAVL